MANPCVWRPTWGSLSARSGIAPGTRLELSGVAFFLCAVICGLERPWEKPAFSAGDWLQFSLHLCRSPVLQSTISERPQRRHVSRSPKKNLTRFESCEFHVLCQTSGHVHSFDSSIAAALSSPNSWSVTSQDVRKTSLVLLSTALHVTMSNIHRSMSTRTNLHKPFTVSKHHGSDPTAAVETLFDGRRPDIDCRDAK